MNMLKERAIRAYHRDGVLPSNTGKIIYVFSSDMSGQHSAGSAKTALLNFDAKPGTGEGRTGSAYAIPTKDHKKTTRTLKDIKASVNRFIAYSKGTPNLTYFITRIGCDRAGYDDEDIATMFKGASFNCIFPEDWQHYL